MRKSKLLAGLYNVYVVYDKISKHYTKMYFASTDQEMIRKYLPEIISSVALREINLFKIGIFNDVTGELKPTVKKLIKTDCYLFPHSRLSPNGEDVSLEDVERVVQETKNQVQAILSTNNSDNKED